MIERLCGLNVGSKNRCIRGVVRGVPDEIKNTVGYEKFILGPNIYDMVEKGLIVYPFRKLERELTDLENARMSSHRKRKVVRALCSSNYETGFENNGIFVPYRLLEHLGIEKNGYYILEATILGDTILLYRWYLFPNNL